MTDPTDGRTDGRTEDGSQIGIWQEATDTHESEQASKVGKRRLASEEGSRGEFNVVIFYKHKPGNTG